MKKCRMTRISTSILLIIYVFIWIEYCAGELQVSITDDQIPYNGAVKSCNSLPNGEWSLSFPKGASYYDVIHEKYRRAMMTESVDSVWLPLRKQHLDGWRYLSNNTYNGDVLGKGDCGGLSLSTGTVQGFNCESPRYGWVCQKVCDFCPPEVSMYNCIRDGSTCYILGCDAGSWYDARNECQKEGAYLVEITDQSAALKLAKEIKKSYRPCQDYWTGLRKADWVFKSGVRGDVIPELTYWGQNEPSSSGDCAVLRRNDKGFFWAAVSCNSQHSYICTTSAVTDG